MTHQPIRIPTLRDFLQHRYQIIAHYSHSPKCTHFAVLDLARLVCSKCGQRHPAFTLGNTLRRFVILVEQAARQFLLLILTPFHPRDPLPIPPQQARH
jgi:hypothetical protein